MTESPSSGTPSTDARESILAGLRAGLIDPTAAFKVSAHPEPRGAPPTPLTHAEGDLASLISRFGASLDGVLGTYEVVETPEAVPLRVAAHISALGRDGSTDGLSFAKVLSWAPDALGVPGLLEHLADEGVAAVIPDDLHDVEQRAEAANIAVGITSVDAAIATTGTLVMRAGPAQSRVASLLPLHHIALVPTSRIHPTVEDWIASVRQSGRMDQVVRQSAQLTFVTGPSKSADIELTLTLGVHGPRTVHAIVYAD